eukprot:gene8107-5643_t
MHNGHCAWRSVRCARVRTEHHTARPLVLWPPYVRGAGHAEAWRGAATTRGRTPTGKGALEVTGPRVGCPQQPPATHTHTSLHTGCMRRESAGGRVEHRAIRQGKGCFQAYWGDNTLYHKDSKSDAELREPGEGLAEESYHHTVPAGATGSAASDWGDNAQSSYADAAPPRRCGGLAALLERMASDAHEYAPSITPRAPLFYGPLTPYAHGKGALEVTGPGSGARSSPRHTHTSLHTGCMRRESAGGRVEHRAIRQGKGCFQAYWGDNTLYHKDSKSDAELREPGEGLAEESYHHTPLGRQCVISRVVITTMLFESIIICRCCTPAPVWRAGGVAGADGLIRASTRLERTQDMHNGHCAWRSVRCARVRTEHHTARPLVLWPPYVRGAGHAEAWRGAATTRGRTPTGKGALEVTGPRVGCPQQPPTHTHTHLYTRDACGGRALAGVWNTARSDRAKPSMWDLAHYFIVGGHALRPNPTSDEVLLMEAWVRCELGWDGSCGSLEKAWPRRATTTHRAGGCDGQRGVRLGRQCVISRVVITTMLFESIIICRCCTPAPVWRAGGVAGADGLIRASTRLERTQDMHNGHCAWRSVRCARVRTEHHTARPLVLWPPYVRGAGHAEAWRGAATTRGRTPTGKGALEVTGPGSGARSSPATHTSLHTGCMRRESAGGRVEHRAIRQGKGCFQAYWGDNTLYHKDSKSDAELREPGEGLAEESYHHTPLGRQCVISRVVITTMLFESIIICRCCTPAPVWRAGGVAGADGLIRASTRLERTQDMHNGHCAWRSVRCARVRTEHHTARPLVLWPPYVRGAGHAEAWRGAATTRGRTPTGKGALEVTGPGSGARSSPRHTHTSLHTGCMRRESAGGRVEHRAIRQGKGCFQAYWGDNTLYHKDSKSPSMWDLAHYFIVGGHALRPNPTSDEVLLVEPGCVANLGGMRSCGSLEKAWPRRATTTHRAGGCDGQRGVRLGRQCVISRVVITTMLFESIIICRCCTPAPVWRAGGVAGADGLIRASTRLERTQDMHNGHCAWRSVRCARVRTEHHTARPLVLWPPYVRGAGHAEAWRGAATTRGRTPTGKGALEVTGRSAGGRVEHRAIRQGKGCFQACVHTQPFPHSGAVGHTHLSTHTVRGGSSASDWGDNTLYHKDSKSDAELREPGEGLAEESYHHTPLGRQCVISRVVITTMLFESIIICRCCTPAPVWRAGGVAGADGLIRASTRLERTQDMHNGHCAWRSVRCARVRTEHHTARPLVLWPPYVRGAGHAEAWRGAATTRGRTPTGKGALEVTGPRSGARSSPPHTHISTHGMHAAGERWRACGTPRDQTGQRQVSHTQPFPHSGAVGHTHLSTHTVRGGSSGIRLGRQYFVS